MVNLVYNKERT